MKKIISLILVLVLIVSMLQTLSLTLFAETSTSVWDGSITKPAGTGAESTPYLITNGSELAWYIKFAEDWKNTRFAKLTDDIYLNDITKINWETGESENGYTPNEWFQYTSSSDKTIGDKFLGNLNGDGHAVYGLYFNKPESVASIGLIPIQANDYSITVKNLGIDKSYIASNGKSSAIFGCAEGVDKIIENCYVGKDVTIIGKCAGVALGSGQKITINKFYSLAKTTGSTYYGVIADSWGTKSLSNAFAVGTAITSKTSNTIPCTNVYADNTLGASGAEMRTADNMQGLDALTSNTKMSGLAECGAFVATEGYPALTVFPIIEEEPTLSVWDGTVAKPDGAGTESDPYKITNGSELAWFIRLFDDWKNTRYAVLTDDIYLNDVAKIDWATGVVEEGYTPKVWLQYTTAENKTADKFLGNLDGAGHIIYGMYFNDTTNSANVGLIPIQHTTYTSTIKNLGIDKAFIATGGKASALFANAEGAEKTIENCYVGKDVTLCGEIVGVALAYGVNFNINKFYSLATVNATVFYGVVGNSWGQVRNLSNAFVVGTAVTSKTANSIICENVYGDITVGGIGASKRTIDNMQGFGALTVFNKMPDLAKCEAFRATKEYPVLKSFNYVEPKAIITLNPNGGTLVSNKLKVAIGSVIELPSPIKEGYIFKAWYTNQNYTQLANNIVPDNSTTYYAKWYKKYDIDNNGVALQTLDLTRLVQALLRNESNDLEDFSIDAADCNEDTVISILDLVRLKKVFANANEDFLDDNYRLVWSDEFNTKSYDTSKWVKEDDYDGDRVSNNENLKISDGVATLSTTYNSESGKYNLSHNLTTGNTMNFKYGYVEMRAKMPYYGKGEWPAFWLLSSSSAISKDIINQVQPDYHIEIDIAENLSNATKNQAQLHLWHNTDSSLTKTNLFALTGANKIGSWTGSNIKTFENSDVANAWHTYGLKWTETSLIFYVDRNEMCEYIIPEDYKDEFSEYMSIIISNNYFTPDVVEKETWATAGTFFEENPTESVDMVIDYVRLYQNAETDSILIK